MSLAQRALMRSAIEIGAAFTIEGRRSWVATRPNASGGTDTIGTLTPVYIVQEVPSRLERVFAQSAAAVRARWVMIARSDTVSLLAVGDTLASGALAFLVTGLDSIAIPGLTSATLEKQPFT